MGQHGNAFLTFFIFLNLVCLMHSGLQESHLELTQCSLGHPDSSFSKVGDDLTMKVEVLFYITHWVAGIS